MPWEGAASASRALEWKEHGNRVAADPWQGRDLFLKAKQGHRPICPSVLPSHEDTKGLCVQFIKFRSIFGYWEQLRFQSKPFWSHQVGWRETPVSFGSMHLCSPTPRMTFSSHLSISLRLEAMAYLRESPGGSKTHQGPLTVSANLDTRTNCGQLPLWFLRNNWFPGF